MRPVTRVLIAIAVSVSAFYVTNRDGSSAAPNTVQQNVWLSTILRERGTLLLRPAPSSAYSTRTRAWMCIRWNESRDDYTQPGGGAYQFEGTTWFSITGLSSTPQESPPSVQNAAALSLYRYDARVWGDPWHAWSTRFVCGL